MLNCQEMRVIRRKPLGKLQFLFILKKINNFFFINFITNLPESIVYKKTYNTIFVVVNKLF